MTLPRTLSSTAQQQAEQLISKGGIDQIPQQRRQRILARLMQLLNHSPQVDQQAQ